LLGPLHRLESGLTSLALVAMVLLPIAEIVSRLVAQRGIPGSGPFVQHLTLWVGFLGAALAARENRLLALATGQLIPAGRWREASGLLIGLVGAAVSTVLAFASWEPGDDRAGGRAPRSRWGSSVWMAQLVLPVGFAAARAAAGVERLAARRWGRGVAALGVLLGLWVARAIPEVFEGRSVLPSLAPGAAWW
jgi:C4-dicarboxylate transporter, DctM subunit